MGAMIIDFIKFGIYTLVGGYFIDDAITNFKKQSYFVFGVDIMLVIYEVCLLVYYVFVA